MEAVANMNQMSLPTFCKSFDMPRETVLELIRGNKRFPGYKIGGRWYIDIIEFKEWREKNNNWDRVERKCIKRV